MHDLDHKISLSTEVQYPSPFQRNQIGCIIVFPSGTKEGSQKAELAVSAELSASPASWLLGLRQTRIVCGIRQVPLKGPSMHAFSEVAFVTGLFPVYMFL